jgi:hypothetical protein
MISVKGLKRNAENEAAQVFNKIDETVGQGAHIARLTLRGGNRMYGGRGLNGKLFCLFS